MIKVKVSYTAKSEFAAAAIPHFLYDDNHLIILNLKPI